MTRARSERGVGLGDPLLDRGLLLLEVGEQAVEDRLLLLEIVLLALERRLGGGEGRPCLFEPHRVVVVAPVSGVGELLAAARRRGRCRRRCRWRRAGAAHRVQGDGAFGGGVRGARRGAARERSAAARARRCWVWSSAIVATTASCCSVVASSFSSASCAAACAASSSGPGLDHRGIGFDEALLRAGIPGGGDRPARAEHEPQTQGEREHPADPSSPEIAAVAIRRKCREGPSPSVHTSHSAPTRRRGPGGPHPSSGGSLRQRSRIGGAGRGVAEAVAGPAHDPAQLAGAVVAGLAHRRCRACGRGVAGGARRSSRGPRAAARSDTPGSRARPSSSARRPVGADGEPDHAQRGRLEDHDGEDGIEREHERAHRQGRGGDEVEDAVEPPADAGPHAERAVAQQGEEEDAPPIPTSTAVCWPVRAPSDQEEPAEEHLGELVRPERDHARRDPIVLARHALSLRAATRRPGSLRSMDPAWARHLPEGVRPETVDLLARRSLPAAWAERWAAAPERRVLHDAGTWYTAGDLDRRSRLVAARLARAGLVAGDIQQSV